MEQTIYNEQLTPTTDANPLTFTFKNRVLHLGSIELHLIDSTTGIGSYLVPGLAYSFDPDAQVLTLANNPFGLFPYATYQTYL